MATEIGVVTSAIGKVTATSTDGTIRTLDVGDLVYADDLIITGPAAAVEIEFADGSVMDLGRSSQMVLDTAVFDPQASDVVDTDAEQVPEEVAAIQQAILQGEDPTEVTEAPAAGAGVAGSDGGHDAVFIDYLNPETIPDAGFETTGVTSAIDDIEEEESVLDVDEIEEEFPVVPEEPPAEGEPPTDDEPPVVDPDAEPLVFGAEESALSRENGDNSEGNREAGDTNTDDEINAVSGILTTLFAADDTSLSISLSDDTDSLPRLYSNGTEVNYSVSGDQLTATAGEFTVFTLTVNEDGSFTFDLQDQLDHVDDGTDSQNQALFTGDGNEPVDGIDLSSILIATDSDGDSITGAGAGQFVINIEDDVPTVSAQPPAEPTVMTLDETVGEHEGDPNADDETDTTEPGAIGYASVDSEELFNFSITEGADGENESARKYSLSLNFASEGDTEVSSGLSSHNGEIMLSFDGDEVIGHDGETEVFRITMNSEGDVTVTQFKAIDHGEQGTDGDTLVFLSSGVLSAALTIYDNDGDADTAESELGNLIAFEDDAPIAEADNVDVATSQFVEGNVFDNDTTGEDTPLSLTGIQFADTTYTFDEDGLTDNEGTFITVETDNGTLKIYQDGDYTYTADAPEQTIIDVPDDSLADWQSALGLFAFDGDLPMSGGKLDTDNLNSNASLEYQQGNKGGLGVRSGQQSASIDEDESLLLSLNGKESTSATVGINGMNIGQTDQGQWQAFNADGELVDSGTFNGVNRNGQEFTLNIETQKAFSYLSFDDNPDANLSQGYFVSSLSYQTVVDEQGSDAFTYYVVDADGTTTEAELNIDINGAALANNDTQTAEEQTALETAMTTSVSLTNEEEIQGGQNGNDVVIGSSNSDILIGGPANDHLQGEAGNDTLIGGPGDDIMTGDEGADTFIWNEDDDGSTDNPAVDFVTDFNTYEDDVLNLADLLDSDGTTTIDEDNLDDFLKATFDAESNQTKIDVYKNGDANNEGESTQSIIVSGNQQDLVSMLNKNNLDVDQT